jgi:signal transduction histidine kinase
VENSLKCSEPWSISRSEKQAEENSEKLRQAQLDLAHVTRISTMGELTASLAHEIKQPIGAAVTNAEACVRLIDRSEPDLVEAREAALEMIRDARRAADIIDRVRALYQKGSALSEPVDLSLLIEEMVGIMRDDAGRHGVTIRVDAQQDLPRILGDRVQLQQALMNLMLNGIEAMQESGGDLHVTLQGAPDDQVLVSVSDTGAGIPAENAGKIFDAFFTTKTRGTGLGLAITRSIIQAHGGRIWVASTPGVGAAFHFALPVGNEAAAR